MHSIPHCIIVILFFLGFGVDRDGNGPCMLFVVYYSSNINMVLRLLDSTHMARGATRTSSATGTTGQHLIIQ